MSNVPTDGQQSPLFMQDFTKLVGKQGVDNDDVISMYEQYAKEYNQSMESIHFTAADLTVQYFHKHAKRFDLGPDCVILDVGAGTGRVGALLKQKHGYTTIDGVEPSQGMIDRARECGAYRNLYTGKVGPQDPIPTSDDCYDAVVISGTLVPGHMKYDAFLEILRVLKPGGIVINVMREEFTWDSAECHIRAPFAEWEVKGHWTIIEWAIPEQKYFQDKDALVHVYRKTPRAS